MPKDMNLEQDELDFNSDFKQAMDRLVDGDWESYTFGKESRFDPENAPSLDDSDTVSDDSVEKQKDTSQQAGTAISEGVAEEADPDFSNFFVYDGTHDPCLTDEDYLLYADDPCEPNWCTLYPGNECGLNFNSQNSTPPPGGNEQVFINTLTADSVDTYYSNMLINCEFWPDLDLMTLENTTYNDQGDGSGVMAIQVSVAYVDYTNEFGDPQFDELSFFTDSQPAGHNYDLTYYDVCDYLVEVGIISDVDECADFYNLVWPIITIEDGAWDDQVGAGYGAPYNMQIVKAEEDKIIERYSTEAITTIPASITSLLNAIGTTQFQESRITDKDLIFRVPNDAFKFGTFDTIGSPMPTISTPQTGGSSQSGY